MAQTSRPERTRSLPNLYLEPRDKNFGVTAAFYLARICRLKKQLDRSRGTISPRAGLVREVKETLRATLLGDVTSIV